MGDELIYHIAIRTEWESYADAHTYQPDRNGRDGFIHCSELYQLESVADYSFRGRRDLLLLEIMPTKLEPETRYEQDGKEKYPHIYGPINKDAVARTMEVGSNSDGRFRGVFDRIQA